MVTREIQMLMRVEWDRAVCLELGKVKTTDRPVAIVGAQVRLQTIVGELKGSQCALPMIAVR